MSIVDELGAQEPAGKETAEGKKRRTHILILIGLGSLVLMYLVFRSKSKASSKSTPTNTPSPYGSAYGMNALPYSQASTGNGYGQLATLLSQFQNQQSTGQNSNLTTQTQLQASMASLQSSWAQWIAQHQTTSSGSNTTTNTLQNIGQSLDLGSGNSMSVSSPANAYTTAVNTGQGVVNMTSSQLQAYNQTLGINPRPTRVQLSPGVWGIAPPATNVGTASNPYYSQKLYNSVTGASNGTYNGPTLF